MNGVIEIANYEFEQKKLKELKPVQHIIYNALYSYANVKEKKFIVYPSIETLHEKTNLGVSTICRNLKILVEKGWIAISKQKCKMGNYNQYTLRVIWNNTKTSFFDAGKKLKENKIVKKVSNIIKKDKPVEDPVKVEAIKQEVKQVEKLTKVKEIKTEEERTIEEFNRKERMDMVKRVVNPLQRLSDSFIRLTEKADKEDVFMDAIMPIIDKVVEENRPVSVRYLENALKIALNNKKYYANNLNIVVEENVIDSSLEDDDELIGWF